MPNRIYLRIAQDNLFRIGYYHQISGNLESAAEYYIRSIEQNPSPEAHTLLASVLSQFGDFPAAIKECLKALKIDPSFGYALNDVGSYYIETRKLKKALHYLKKACRSQQYERENAHYNLARVYIHEGMMIKACEELQKALILNPGFESARELLSRIQKQIH